MKKNYSSPLVLILACLLSMLSANAQVTFNKRFGSPGKDYGNAIIPTSDSGFALVGNTNAYGAGGNWLFMKLDRQGNIEWQKDIFGVNVDIPAAVYELSNGNFVIGGETYSYGSGCVDALIVMLDSSGNMLWSKAYGDFNCQNVNDFSPTTDHGYIGCGSANGSNIGWVFKIDSAGELEWSKSYSGTAGFNAVKQIKGGGYNVIGSHGKISVLKLDATGNVVWAKGYSGVGANSATYGLETLDGGAVVVTGEIYVNAYGAIADVFLLKMSSNGDPLWFRTYGFTFQEYGLSVKQVSSTGGYIIGGWTDSYGHGQDDALLIRTDDTGGFVWAKTYGDMWDDQAINVQVQKDKGFVFTGYSFSSDNNNSDSTYIYIVKTDSNGVVPCHYMDWTPLQLSQNYTVITSTPIPTDFGVDSVCNVTLSSRMFGTDNFCTDIISTLNDESKGDIISLYPNPVTDYLTVEGFTGSPLVMVLDITGKVLLSEKLNTDKTIDMRNFASGIYFIKTEKYTGKVVKL